MKKLVIVALVLAVGCATTPNSIKTASATGIMLQKVQTEDTLDIINTYDSEVRHWVDLAYQQAMSESEAALVDADGKVDLVAYKAEVERITKQLASTNAKYDQDKAEITKLVQDKAEKQLLLQILIDEYERSTGVAPETIEQLVSTLGETAKGVMDIYDKRQAEKAAEEAAKGPSLKDKMNTMTNDLFDKVYNEIQTKYADKSILDSVSAAMANKGAALGGILDAKRVK